MAGAPGEGPPKACFLRPVAGVCVLSTPKSLCKHLFNQPSANPRRRCGEDRDPCLCSVGAAPLLISALRFYSRPVCVLPVGVPSRAADCFLGEGDSA